MIIVHNGNFSLRFLKKEPTSPFVPKSAFYGDFRICLVLEGEAVWEIEEKAHRIRKEDMILLAPHQKRQLLSVGEGGLRLCVFKLSRNAFSAIHHFLFFLECVNNQKSVIHSEILSDLLREILLEWEEESPLRYEMASAKLTEFFIKAERLLNYRSRPMKKEQRALLDLMDYIDENVTRGISLRGAAERIGLSESTLSRRFFAFNGITFQQYVTEKKIQHAISLLESSSMKMIDIALESGFESVSGFYDAFKRKTGSTPNRFCKMDL
ncbi:MAG: helix-turn-helix domain-containing protein [Clostridia bacterium]|nr:helix-turn-helix domain-containing protein [Clostridia bacterium]